MAMNGPSRQDVTALLRAWRNGDDEALARLTPLVYDELHRLASRYMRGENAGHTLQTTALMNEAYIKLVDSKRVQCQNRAHFFAIAAQLMRRILVDFVRRRQYQKRRRLATSHLCRRLGARGKCKRRSRGRGRSASGAGEARSAQGSGGGAPVLRRLEPGRDGRSPERVNRHGWPRLESRQGVAGPRVEAMTSERWQQVEQIYQA